MLSSIPAPRFSLRSTQALRYRLLCRLGCTASPQDFARLSWNKKRPNREMIVFSVALIEYITRNSSDE
jgi:hypothetical protein